MKLITKDNEVVEGEPITEAMAKLIDDINGGSLGPIGLALYAHQKREFISYMLLNYELTIKPQEGKAEDPAEPVAAPIEDAALTEA